MSEQKKEYDDNNRGAVWVAENRTQSWHSTHSGSAVVDGVCYYVNADPVAPEELNDVGKGIPPRISFKFKRKPDDQQNYQPPSKQSAIKPVPAQDDDGNDDLNDIPF